MRPGIGTEAVTPRRMAVGSLGHQRGHSVVTKMVEEERKKRTTRHVEE
jgi:hypothetical protein